MTVFAWTDTSTIGNLGSEVAVNEAATVMPSGYSLYGISDRLQKLDAIWDKDNITINNSDIGIIDEFTTETGAVRSVIYAELTSLDKYTINNPFSILFEDCATINGRSINATMTINSITFNALSSVGPGYSEAAVGDRAIIIVGGGTTNQIVFGNGGSLTVDDIKYYQPREMVVDYTVTATYADDGSAFDYGFYQFSYDIDMGNSSESTSYYREGWEVYDDYTSAVYVSDKFACLTKKTSYSSIFAANGEGNITESGEGAVKNDVDLSGLLVTSSGNTMKAKNYAGVGKCGCYFRLYIDNFDSTLDKTVDTATYDTSTTNTRTFSITYTIPEFYSDTYKKYTSLVLYDELPDGVTYKSAKVIDENTGNDITSNGTLKYDSSSNKVSFTFSDSYISDESNYNGQDITLEIVTSISGDDVITNPGYADVSGVTLTDTASVEPLYKITTDVVNGTIDDDVTNISKGTNETINYAPSSGYILKSVTVDGSSVDITKYPSSYTFSNISANHTIKVVYEPTYTITTEVVYGTITSSITGITSGSTETISYSPNSGYVLKSVTVDGTSVSITTYESSYTFSNISADHTIKVVYEPVYKITTSVINGTITSSISGITGGSSKDIAFTPDTGYSLKSITIDGTSIDISSYNSESTDSYTFSNISADHTIDVVYEIAQHKIVITKKVKKSDINYSNGTPTFLFHVTGADINGDTHTYNEIAVLDESLTADSDGYISASCTFEVPAGTYKSTEELCSRYVFNSITSLSNATSSSQTVTYNVISNTTAKATYINEITNFGDFSHNDSVINNCGSVN